MTTSTALPDFFIQHPYLIWIFPAVVIIALIIGIYIAWKYPFNYGDNKQTK